MIEAVMYFALGLLTAGLIALLVAPAIWRRAMRLTRARIEAALPMTRAEIAADKDHLRARFAVANRRLEVGAERLNDRLAGQLAEVERKRTEIAALGREKTELTEKIGGLETRISALGGSLAATEDKLASANAEVARRDQIIAERANEIAAIQTRLQAGQQTGEEQRLELVARDTTIANLKDRVAGLTAEQAAAVAARDKADSELRDHREHLAAERQRTEGLEAGLAAMRAERAERMNELERRAAELKALEDELAAARRDREDAAAEIAALTADRDRLTTELERGSNEATALGAELSASAHRQEELQTVLAEAEATLAAAQSEIATLGAGLGAEAMADGDNLHKAIAATEAEKQALAAKLGALEDDYAALRAENAELRRVAGPEWESQRRENQALRDRLNEIAASVVRLTRANGPARAAANQAETGNGAPREPQPPRRISRPGAPPDTDEHAPQSGRRLSLAERLRALQHASASGR